MTSQIMHEKSNRLINEKSPYLLQHAHNPVDWFPWGEEAFSKATEEINQYYQVLDIKPDIGGKFICCTVGKPLKILDFS